MNRPNITALIRKHQKQVFHIALGVLGPGSEADAEDVAQEVFIKMIRSIDSFRGESSIATWLYRITYNAAVSSRRRMRHTAIHVPPLESDLVASPDVDDEHQTVRALVRDLPDEDRLLIHLHYWLGHSTSEISEIVDRPHATIRSKLSRIRRKLGRRMEQIT